MLITKITRDANLIEQPHLNTSVSPIDFSFDQTNLILSIFMLIGFKVIFSKQARYKGTRSSSYIFPIKLKSIQA